MNRRGGDSAVRREGGREGGKTAPTLVVSTKRFVRFVPSGTSHFAQYQVNDCTGWGFTSTYISFLTLHTLYLSHPLPVLPSGGK